MWILSPFYVPVPGLHARPLILWLFTWWRVFLYPHPRKMRNILHMGNMPHQTKWTNAELRAKDAKVSSGYLQYIVFGGRDLANWKGLYNLNPTWKSEKHRKTNIASCIYEPPMGRPLGDQLLGGHCDSQGTAVASVKLCFSLQSFRSSDPAGAGLEMPWMPGLVVG